MKTITELNKYCKKTGKNIVLKGRIHKGYVRVETDTEIADRAHNKHKKGRVF